MRWGYLLIAAPADEVSTVARVLLAMAAGLVVGWGTWLTLQLVLDATVGTHCGTFCPMLPGDHPCSTESGGCLLPARLPTTLASAIGGLLVLGASLRYLRGGRPR